MQFFDNNTGFPVDQVVPFGITMEAVENEGGHTEEAVHTWEIGGKFFAATQAELTNTINQYRAVFTDGGIAYFNDNNGALTAHAIGERGALNLWGVKVVRLHFPASGIDGEYSNWRTWRATLQSTYVNPVGTISAAFESIRYTGGGPMVRHREVLNGPPQAQILKPATVFRAVQSGFIVGRTGHILPVPLFPLIELRDIREVEFGMPRRRGPVGKAILDRFRVDYTMYYESPLPFFSLPHYWTE